MSREVRRVPANWEHPTINGTPRPLLYRYDFALADFSSAIKKYGLSAALDCFNGGPVSHNYMPAWSDEDRTHWQMYETTTEGTPISPVMETPEELAQWLYDNNASTFARETATYDEWLAMIRRGYSYASFVVFDGQIKSGVRAVSEDSK